MEPIVLVHGGAGDIPDSRDRGKHNGVRAAARVGYKVLRDTGSALNAVEEAVKSMELDENFNAGYGSVLTLNETVEMEASIMRGLDLATGCVTLLRDIKHPISLARMVMETPHNFLGGEGAMEFARKQGVEILSPPGQLVTDIARRALETFKKKKNQGISQPGKTEIGQEGGTVGAVAIDSLGRIAVATSTGGMTGKYVGRIGDTPQEMTKVTGGTAGAITIDKVGNVGIYFSSQKMSWAYQKGDQLSYGIRHGDNFSERA